MDKLRIACVGAGYFAAFHRDGWERIDRAEPVGVCDHDLAKAEATGWPAFDDLSRMLETLHPDVLDVILPPVAHAQAIDAAIAAVVPTVICQKPFGRDVAEGTALTERAAEAGLRLIVHENIRFQPWYRTMRAAIDAGRIGTPLQASFRLRPGDGQGPDAYLNRQPYFQQMPRFLVHETAVHWIDTFRYLLGDSLAVYADLRRVNPVIAGEDAGMILLDHPNGAVSLFDGNRLIDHAATDPRRTMGEALVEGTEGVLALWGDGSVTLRGFGETRTEELLPPDTTTGFGGDCVWRLQSHVVAGLLDGTPIENMASDYLTVLKAVDACYRSSDEGRKIALA